MKILQNLDRVLYDLTRQIFFVMQNFYRVSSYKAEFDRVRSYKAEFDSVRSD